MLSNIVEKKKSSNGNLSIALTQVLKGICCILVGLHHFARILVEQHGSHNPIYLLLQSQGGNIGVGLFFFLSGYGLYQSSIKRRLGVKEIFAKRFWKLYWPILIVNGIFIFITNQIGSFRLFDYLINFKSIDGVLWFVEILFGCYAIFYLIQMPKMQKNRWLLFYSLGICYTILIMILRPSEHWHYTNIPMFFLGVLYAQYSEEFVGFFTTKRIIVWAIGLFVLSGIGWFILHTMWARLGICIEVLLVLLMLAQKWDIDKSHSSWLGKISYEYYLTHYKVLMILTAGGAAPSLIVFLLTSVGSAAAIHYLLNIKSTVNGILTKYR